MENNEPLVVINIQRKFTLEDINDIVSTACEGGINSWVKSAYVTKPIEPTSELWYHAVALGGELKFYIHNGKDLEGTPGVQKDKGGWFTTLDLDKLKKGLQIYQDKFGIPLDIGDIDDEVSSGIIECACFGEVVFC